MNSGRPQHIKNQFTCPAVGKKQALNYDITIRLKVAWLKIPHNIFFIMKKHVPNTNQINRPFTIWEHLLHQQGAEHLQDKQRWILNAINLPFHFIPSYKSIHIRPEKLVILILWKFSEQN